MLGGNGPPPSRGARPRERGRGHVLTLPRHQRDREREPGLLAHGDPATPTLPAVTMWPPHLTATATGWSRRPPGRSPRTATRQLRLEWPGSRSTSPSWVSPACRTARATGSWQSDGGIFSFGDACLPAASMGGTPLNQPIVGITSTPTARATGWWPPTAASSPSATAPFTARPGTSAQSNRSSGCPPTRPATGTWLVASDGGIFTFGDAQFYGSTGNIRLNKPVRAWPESRDRPRLLADRLGRRDLHLRRRPVLRIGRLVREVRRQVSSHPEHSGLRAVDSDGTRTNFGW